MQKRYGAAIINILLSSSMSTSTNKKRSYRDAVIGGRYEFIGSPMTSGGKAGASGASSPSREIKTESSNKKKSPVIPETPEAHQSAGAALVDWEAAFDSALMVGRSELVVPAQDGDSGSTALIVTRSLPVLPEHRDAVVKFIRNFPWEGNSWRRATSTVPRGMVLKDLKLQFTCNRKDADKLLQLSAFVRQRFYAESADSTLVENHAIALWCGKILFENDKSYSDSQFVHEEVPEDDHDEGADQVPSPSHAGSPNLGGKDAEDHRGDAGESSVRSDSSGVDADALPEDSHSPAPSNQQLLSPNVAGITHEERPAFVEYVLSLMEEPSLLDVHVLHSNKDTRKRRQRVIQRLMERFTIDQAEAKRLLQVSHLVHRRFRALKNGVNCNKLCSQLSHNPDNSYHMILQFAA